MSVFLYLRLLSRSARQMERELRKLTDLAVDGDRTAVLLHNDVVADRQAEPGALAGRLGGEKRLEQFVPDVGRNPNAVVADADLDRVTEIARRHLQRRAEVRCDTVALAFGRRVKAVCEQVEENAGDVLRDYFDRGNRRLEIAFERDVELLVLGAGAVIGKVERLLDQIVEVDHAMLAALAARMLEHALDDAVGRLPCSAIFSRLPVSIATISSRSASLSSSSAARAGAAVSF